MTKIRDLIGDEQKINGFRQKNHMVNAGKRRRVSQVRAFGTSDGANKGWDKRGRGRAKKNFTPPTSVVKTDMDKQKEAGLKWAKGKMAELIKKGWKKDEAGDHIAATLGREWNIGVQRYVQKELNIGYDRNPEPPEEEEEDELDKF